MSSSSSRSSGGIGFLGLLTILFIGLKLTGHIDWSWLWVFAPLWMPAAFVLSLVLLLIALGLLLSALGKPGDYRFGKGWYAGRVRIQHKD